MSKGTKTEARVVDADKFERLLLQARVIGEEIPAECHRVFRVSRTYSDVFSYEKIKKSLELWHEEKEAYREQKVVDNLDGEDGFSDGQQSEPPESVDQKSSQYTSIQNDIQFIDDDTGADVDFERVSSAKEPAAEPVAE